MDLPRLVGGAVIIENVFNIPGLGRLAIDALQLRDYPTVSALNLIVALTITGVNLMVDLVYPYLDPRIRYR